MAGTLLRAAVQVALASGTEPRAQLLQMAEWLRWTDLPANSCFVMPLTPCP